MHNTNFPTFSTIRKTDRLICVWVPARNPKMPLTCVWLEDKQDPADCVVYSSSPMDAPDQEDRRMHPCR